MTQELLFTDTAGLYALDEATGQLSLLAAITGDVNGVAFDAGALAVAGGLAYFAAGDAASPASLYVSDGTASGTTLLQTFPGSNATIADFTALANGGAVFVNDDGNGNQTLWTINGTTVTQVTLAGTATPYDNTSASFLAINLGPGQSGEIGGNLLFTDSSGLYALNEATSQVTLLAAITEDVNGAAYQAGALAVSGGHAYFAGGDTASPASLYISDGTAAGTLLLRTFSGSNATLTDFTALSNGGAVFVYNDGAGHQTLWTVDGASIIEVTIAGTATAYDNTSGSTPGIDLGPGQSGEIDGHLLFTDTSGLYALDPATSQVSLLAAITIDVTGIADQAGSLAVCGGRAYFAAGDATNPLGLYVSDGTAAGTTLLKTFSGAFANATLADFTALSNGDALFVYYDGNGNETLWTTDGTTVSEVAVAGTPYDNTSASFPAINLGPGQSGELPIACFCRGTRIATPSGEVAVEHLAAGDLVVTASGVPRPIRWIGWQAVALAAGDTNRPVRIAAGAFGEATPRRDLLLSPEHAVLVNGVLIPIRHLAGRPGIAIDTRLTETTYFHIELAVHACLLAENLPCESWLDIGNRGSFANGRTPRLPPDIAPDEFCEARWEAFGCAPLRVGTAARPPTTIKVADLLQPAWYLATYPDVAVGGIDAAAHFAGWGRREGRLPCPEVDLLHALALVDPSTLAITMADVAAAGLDPAAHFCAQGWRERRRPNPYFATGWYLDTHDVPAGMNPLVHYVLHGEDRDLPPSRHFDPGWYRDRYDIAPGASALAHFLQHRRTGRVSPLPSFDVAAYISAHAVLPGRDPYAHFLAATGQRGVRLAA